MDPFGQPSEPTLAPSQLLAEFFAQNDELAFPLHLVDQWLADGNHAAIAQAFLASPAQQAWVNLYAQSLAESETHVPLGDYLASHHPDLAVFFSEGVAEILEEKAQLDFVAGLDPETPGGLAALVETFENQSLPFMVRRSAYQSIILSSVSDDWLQPYVQEVFSEYQVAGADNPAVFQQATACARLLITARDTHTWVTPFLQSLILTDHVVAADLLGQMARCAEPGMLNLLIETAANASGTEVNASLLQSVIADMQADLAPPQAAPPGLPQSRGGHQWR